MKKTKYFSLSAILILIMLCVFAAGCVSPQARLAQAKKSFEDQNYRVAYQRLKPLAERGIPDAQYALGYLYYYGLGAVENRELGRQWIQLAADAGYEPAQRALTIMK